MFRLYIPCYCGHTAFVKNPFMTSNNKDPERSEIIDRPERGEDLIKRGKENQKKRIMTLFEHHW